MIFDNTDRLTRGVANDRVISMKRWLVLSLIAPKTLVEPISNFLMEQGAAGIEEAEESFEQERVKAYFPRDGKEGKVLRSLRRYLKSLSRMNSTVPHMDIQTASIPDQDWGENCKQYFKPIRVGSRFIVKPPWVNIRPKKNEIQIEINPGMAFGTGTHATTQLCLESLEKRLKKGRSSVLDVGTGSGILAIAAVKLGASEALGIDIDRLAVQIARENVNRNGVSGRVRIRRAGIGNVQKKFDLVVANIDYRNLRRARASMLHHLKKHGFLILSGILLQQDQKLKQHYIETGALQWMETIRKEEWVCLTFEKKES